VSEDCNITLEWAKQLIFDSIGQEFDFANMRATVCPPGYWAYVLPVFDETVSMCDYKMGPGYRLHPPIMETESIELQRYYDPNNMEVTRLGYGELSNTIVIGRTVGIEYLL